MASCRPRMFQRGSCVDFSEQAYHADMLERQMTQGRDSDGWSMGVMSAPELMPVSAPTAPSAPVLVLVFQASLHPCDGTC